MVSLFRNERSRSAARSLSGIWRLRSLVISHRIAADRLIVTFAPFLPVHSAGMLSSSRLGITALEKPVIVANSFRVHCIGAMFR
jgi:hypothetical protein